MTVESLPPKRRPTGEIQVTKKDLKKMFRWQDAAVILAILSGFVGGYIHLISEAKAQTDAGIAPLEARMKSVEQEQRQVKEDLHEVQMDIRALYKATMTGERQPRLEKPIDGGP